MEIKSRFPVPVSVQTGCFRRKHEEVKATMWSSSPMQSLLHTNQPKIALDHETLETKFYQQITVDPLKESQSSTSKSGRQQKTYLMLSSFLIPLTMDADWVLSALNYASYALIKCKFLFCVSPKAELSHLELRLLSWYMHPTAVATETEIKN